jgi:hypothetical protein
VTLEEILPELKKGNHVKRESQYSTLALIDINNKLVLKIWNDSFPSSKNTYRISSEDVLAKDWRLA